jgi:tRNA A37 N6-isopentenylltransferase MiaA
MVEEHETTDQFIHKFNDAKVSDGKFSQKMLQKFVGLEKLDKQMKWKSAAAKQVKKHYEKKEKQLATELAKQLEPLNTERTKKLSEIEKEYTKKLNELERVKKEKVRS